MNTTVIDKKTIQKHDIPGPRYTSYPTAPEWNDAVGSDIYGQKLAQFGDSDKTLSLYIHVPFCQSMCTYCACSVVIRPQEEKYGDQYLSYLFREIDLIADRVGSKKTIKQFHWGGGTPTFLNEDQVERLFHKVQSRFDIDLDGEVAIEIDPRTIDRDKVKKLKELGFNRVSMGVQDFDENVQEKVNRIQSYELVKEFYDWCRELSFDSVNFDLIYGLPGQTTRTFSKTVNNVIALKPDRIALYSFAYVPWLKKHQSKIDEQQLPSNDEKLEIFLNSRAQFLELGYQAIAMDHFALEGDELAVAFRKGELHRNFMGYTVKPADEFIGIGLTSIGFLQNTFVQNHKTMRDYFQALDQNELPVERGKILTHDDQVRRWVINSLMCQFKVDKGQFADQFGQSFDDYFAQEQGHIEKCVQNDLLKASSQVLEVTYLGKIFIRNVCMGFDWYFQKSKSHRRFSQTV